MSVLPMPQAAVTFYGKADLNDIFLVALPPNTAFIVVTEAASAMNGHCFTLRRYGDSLTMSFELFRFSGMPKGIESVDRIEHDALIRWLPCQSVEIDFRHMYEDCTIFGSSLRDVLYCHVDAGFVSLMN